VVAASHLSELIDQMVLVMEPEGMLETQYEHFCNLRKRDFDPDESEWVNEYQLVWESAEKIFTLYNNLPGMGELEVELWAVEEFAPEFDPEIEREEMIRNLFGCVISYIDGQKHAELEDISPRILQQMTFKGHGFDMEYFPYHWTWYVPPEPDYPESIEDLERWMEWK